MHFCGIYLKRPNVLLFSFRKNLAFLMSFQKLQSQQISDIYWMVRELKGQSTVPSVKNVEDRKPGSDFGRVRGTTQPMGRPAWALPCRRRRLSAHLASRRRQPYHAQPDTRRSARRSYRIHGSTRMVWIQKRAERRVKLPFQVNSDGSSSENFSITKANVTGLCSLRRSKSASFNADQSVLSGSVVVENARANADYTVTFAGVGEAPAQTVSGQVVERVDKLFADIQINLDNLVPQNIASYTARSGHDLLESASNLDGNNMKDVHSAGFRKALREILEKTMASNVKVQIKQVHPGYEECLFLR
nr:uncharacterized protein LOC113800613 [Penaeus vannamei]